MRHRANTAGGALQMQLLLLLYATQRKLGMCSIGNECDLKMRCPKSGGWDTADFGHAFPNRTYFRARAHVRFRSASPEIRRRKRKEKRKKKEFMVKHKSAEILCRAA